MCFLITGHKDIVQLTLFVVFSTLHIAIYQSVQDFSVFLPFKWPKTLDFDADFFKISVVFFFRKLAKMRPFSSTHVRRM